METLTSCVVHKSLIQSDLILGIPKDILLILVVAAVVLAAMLGPVFAASAVVFYVPCYFLSREDPLMLSMALESLFQADYLEG
jgi:type IV secretory pathway VirB3-like protein